MKFRNYWIDLASGNPQQIMVSQGGALPSIFRVESYLSLGCSLAQKRLVEPK
jgi:hypothetical protein